MRYELNYIEPGSVFRLIFFIILVIGGLLSLIYIVISIFIGRIVIALIIFAVVVPIVAFLKAGIAWICVNIYNIFAKKFGGIMINLIT